MVSTKKKIYSVLSSNVSKKECHYPPIAYRGANRGMGK
jgi:hypothetical protein